MDSYSRTHSFGKTGEITKREIRKTEIAPESLHVLMGSTCLEKIKKKRTRGRAVSKKQRGKGFEKNKKGSRNTSDGRTRGKRKNKRKEV